MIEKKNVKKITVCERKEKKVCKWRVCQKDCLREKKYVCKKKRDYTRK